MQDIEQLVSVGKELGACPYYGTRQAVPSAQVYYMGHVNSLGHKHFNWVQKVMMNGNQLGQQEKKEA